MKTTFISNRQFQVRGTNFESFKGMAVLVVAVVVVFNPAIYISINVFR